MLICSAAMDQVDTWSSKNLEPRQITSELGGFIRCFLMVPPCGFLFLRLCGGCAFYKRETLRIVTSLNQGV